MAVRCSTWRNVANLTTAQLSPADQARLDAITAHLPADWQERLARVRSEVDLEPSGVEEAIDPSLYECRPTAFSNYANSRPLIETEPC